MDMCWLDDQFLVSGSKDAKMALWRIQENYDDSDDNGEEKCPTYADVSPLAVKECRAAQKVLFSLNILMFFLLIMKCCIAFRYDHCVSMKNTKRLL